MLKLSALNNDQIHYANIGLMIVSAILAFILPFELFLFSYAVLGPLHYLTEIGWLHKKNYYTKGKYDFVFLTILCALVFYFSFQPPFMFKITAGHNLKFLRPVKLESS